MNEDIAARLSALPEDRVLDCFWMMHRDGAEPLELLKQFAGVRVWRPKGWDVKRIRGDVSRSAYGRPPNPKCFGCSNMQAIQYHHVIQIQHGGSNDFRNVVPVCFNCHQRLHPWLVETRPKRGFEWVRNIMPRVLNGLEHWWRRSA